LPSLDLILWITTAALSAVVLLRIALARFWHNPALRGLAVMLSVTLLRDLLLARMSFPAHSYTVAWEATLPVLLVSHAYAAISAYTAIAAMYAKIGRFAIRLFVAALVVAAILCAFTTFSWELKRITGTEAFVRWCFLLYRWVDGLAAGGLIQVTAFLSLFRKPFKRMPTNVTRHAALLAAYFSCQSALFFGQNLSGLSGIITVQHLAFTFIAILYLGWTVLLSPHGELTEPWPALPSAVLDHLNDRGEFAAKLARHAAP
jgi:hypothetical protein